MDIICLGETMVDIITYPVEEILLQNDNRFAERIVLKTGGDALNNAIDLSVIGNKVGYVGTVSTDFCGDHILDTLKTYGVNIDYVTRTQTPHTKMNILLSSSGNKTPIYFPGAASEFSLRHFDLSLLSQTKILQFSSTFHMTSFDGELGALTLLKEAKRRGVITSMDTTFDYSGQWDQILHPCYPYLDYFLPSEEQAVLLSGTSDIEKSADYFLSCGVGHVVIKLGSKGVYYASEKAKFYCGCHQVPVVDPTGAGDAFIAGFLTGILHGFFAEECVKLGATASAFVIQQVGANEGIQCFDVLMDYLQNHPMQICHV